MDPLLKVLLVFAGIVAMPRRWLPLGGSLVAGGVALDFWAGHDLVAVAADLGQALCAPELWLLVLDIVLIMEIGRFLARRENAQTVVEAARRLGGKRGALAGLIAAPAVIGMVPMPGGALVSAPLVGSALEGEAKKPEWQAAVNYWFRHILEYWWPLYPVVIVTLSIFPGVEAWQFFLVQMPFTLVSLAAGYLFLLDRGRIRGGEGGKQPAPPNRISVARALAPILLVAVSALVLPELLRLVLPGLNGPLRKMLGMFLGLLAALAMVRRHSASFGDYKMFAEAASRKTANIVFTLVGVMVFQSLLSASGLIPEASLRLTGYRVPVAMIIAILPLVAGLVTGIAIGFAGISFPLVVGFVQSGQGGLAPLSGLVLAFVMGYAGMMLSPVHLCFVLTKEYFGAEFPRIYRLILPCVAMVVAFGMALHLALRGVSL